MMGYYLQFIPHFADLAEPLVHQLKNKVPFTWVTKTSDLSAFCEALSSSPVLVQPDFDSPFILFRDASDVAI